MRAHVRRDQQRAFWCLVRSGMVLKSGSGCRLHVRFKRWSHQAGGTQQAVTRLIQHCATWARGRL